MAQTFTRGGSAVYPFENFTSRMRELLALAQAEAQKRGHPYTRTEHLLLACLGNPEFHSAQGPRGTGPRPRDFFGASLDRIKTEIASLKDPES